MDPDRCLYEIRSLISQSRRLSPYPPSYHLKIENHNELCEKIEALDRWLTTGGFRPEAWQYSERKII